MSLICERGHRPKEREVGGDKCRVRMGERKGGPECGERFAQEPEVRRCQRCTRGIYSEGWCSFCGCVDPLGAETPDPPKRDEKRPGQSPSERARASRIRRLSRKVARSAS